jgi:hypothetical protein
MELEFIETPTFTRLIIALLNEDEYRELQNRSHSPPHWNQWQTRNLNAFSGSSDDRGKIKPS